MTGADMLVLMLGVLGVFVGYGVALAGVLVFLYFRDRIAHRRSLREAAEDEAAADRFRG